MDTDTITKWNPLRLIPQVKAVECVFIRVHRCPSVVASCQRRNLRQSGMRNAETADLTAKAPRGKGGYLKEAGRFAARGTGGWKTATTGRLENLPYIASFQSAVALPMQAMRTRQFPKVNFNFESSRSAACAAGSPPTCPAFLHDQNALLVARWLILVLDLIGQRRRRQDRQNRIICSLSFHALRFDYQNLCLG